MTCTTLTNRRPGPGSACSVRCGSATSGIFASANLVSLTGTWMQRIGQDWLVLQLSDDSGVALGLDHRAAVRPHPAAQHVRRRARRPLRQAPAAARHPGAAWACWRWCSALLVATDVVALWHVFVLAGGLGAVAAHRRPGAAVLRVGDGRPGPADQRGQPQLHDLQRRPADRARRSPALLIARLVGGHRAGLLRQRRQLRASPSCALPGMRAGELRRSPPVARAKGQLREGLAYTRAHPDLVLAMALAFVVGTFGFNYQITIALMARERVRPRAPRRSGCSSTAFAVGSLTGALLSTRRSVRPRQRFLVVSAVVFGRAHRRRRADAGLRRRSPCCWCPPGRRRWCSAWRTTASCSWASTRRCAAGSWRCTSCASWAARPSGRR